MKQVYPEDYSCILPSPGHAGGLFIGNLEASQNLRTLQKHSIKAILTAAKGVDFRHGKHLIPHFMHITAEDHERYDLSVHFHKAADFIHQTIQQTNVMVHCLAGVSRSVSLVIAYFIKYRGMSFQQAYNLIKSRRKIIHPNDGFIAQLKTFENQQKGEQQPHAPSYHPHSASPKHINRQLDLKYQYTEAYSSKVRESSHRQGSPLKKDNDEDLMHSQSQFIAKRTERYQYARGQASYYSPPKKNTEQVNNSGRIRRSSSGRPGTGLQSYESSVLCRGDAGKVYMDTSQIDKKIEEIRKKYQEYSGPSANYNRYNLEQPRKHSKSTLQKADQLKKRSYNYLQEFQRPTARPSARRPLYSYSQY